MDDTINDTMTHTKKKKKLASAILVSPFDKDRSIFSDKQTVNLTNTELYKNIFGMLLFISVFVFGVGHVLLKHKYYLIAAAYFQNVDMVATVLGFSGGPYNIWKYLYNPNNTSDYGFASTTFINYMALVGVGYIALKYAETHSSITRGLARLLIIIPITYLLPGNFIVYLMNHVSTELYNKKIHTSLHWIITLAVGFAFITFIILFEKLVTELCAPGLANVISRIMKYY